MTTEARMSDPIRGRWTITSAYTERDTGDPDCPNYRVGATVKGPEQREPVEVVPVPGEQAIERAAAAVRRISYMFARDGLDRQIARAVLTAALEQPER
jgi:hypothetical protein